MPSVAVLLSAIAADPSDDTVWLALADCLEEQGQIDSAELARLREWLRHAAHDHAERPQREARMQDLLAAGVGPVVPKLRLPLTKRKFLELALIPPGSFLMGGSPNAQDRVDREMAPRQVTLAKAFYLCTHPITQSQWVAVMGNNPSHFKKANRPVEQLTWTDCQHFCQKLSDHTKRNFRLPTEAEWEYACRAATTTLYYSGDSVEALKKVCWCSYEGRLGAAGQSQPVGRYVPNAWGLYDMHGNILDTCAEGEEPIDPGDRRKSHERMVRGGSWGNTPRQCRSSWRFRSTQTARSPWLGCRVLLCE
jgi:uncharacterized protein (TIGR02996 family)